MKLEEKIELDKCIFRYRMVNEKNISAFEKNRLYFSTPENFNDPYDNLLYANLEEILSNVMYNLHYGMDSYLEKLKEKDTLAAFFGYSAWHGTQKEKVIDDFLDGICKAVDFIKKSVRHNVKIICFSETYNSMLMWSHYADNHKGFLLVYDINDIRNAQCFTVDELQTCKKVRLEKVEYVKEQLDLTEDIEDYVRFNIMTNMGDVEPRDGSVPQRKLREFVLQKAEEWSYEKEWRLIPRIIDLEKESPLGYIECVPKAIILGACCDNDEIVNIAKEKGIPIYRIFLSEFSPLFRLEVGEEGKLECI